MRIECRWGGPADGACWNPGACGCCPSSVEAVWRDAHAEQFDRTLRAMGTAFVDAYRLPQIVGWLSKRLAAWRV